MKILPGNSELITLHEDFSIFHIFAGYPKELLKVKCNEKQGVLGRWLLVGKNLGHWRSRFVYVFHWGIISKMNHVLCTAHIDMESAQ
jgi:hypothetical protein